MKLDYINIAFNSFLIVMFIAALLEGEPFTWIIIALLFIRVYFLEDCARLQGEKIVELERKFYN